MINKFVMASFLVFFAIGSFAKSPVASINKVTTIKQGLTKLDFLENTQLEKDAPKKTSTRSRSSFSAIQTQKKLGEINGQAVIHTFPNASQGGITRSRASRRSALAGNPQADSSSSPEYIVTYNNRRNLYGLFYGEISLKLKDWTQRQRILDRYAVTLSLAAEPFLNVKLKNLNDVSSVLASLKQDSNVAQADIVLVEDFAKPQ